MEYPLIAWGLFHLFIFAAIAIDLVNVKGKTTSVSMQAAWTRSLIWILLALFFCLGLYEWQSKESALNFLAAYLLEKSLSIDNLFVFLVIFSYFSISSHDRQRILIWGVLGALVMRAIFIFSGVYLFQKIHWITYLFALFLIFTGARMVWRKDKLVDPKNNLAIRFLQKVIPISADTHEGKFFVQTEGKYSATPLFLALLSVEMADIVFAIDSVPAALAITSDSFIIYTANVFAILGLRSLFFALAGLMERLHYLQYGLALLLVFIGIKMLLAGYIEIPITVTLGVIAAVLLVSTIASFMKTRKD